ncbi:hybrid sensor histidine kinase/response regulator [Pseudodesulfovibrio tunisiensis]|uniref:hybrid sensor histidine kinase/response regulator n=1 Tax=Pseudodesulfovibrio tunisiensis TaxID=463192 RepID=UPI001FB480F1|nr:hybrid sensor histidine kinase/response regulator [Pseudodesulfovibrio tunisiensis]
MRYEPGKPDLPIILLVEDSRSIVAELERRLAVSGRFDVRTAESLAQARTLALAFQDRIFLAILDLILPDAQDGEIVPLFCDMGIPSLVFTSDFNETTRQRVMSSGVIDYVVKDSFAVDMLLEYVERLFRNRDVTVLVVDDSDSSRHSMTGLLHRQMFRAVVAEDAEGALAALDADSSISVVLVDQEMPGMKGVELTSVIRKRFPARPLSLIGVSHLDDPLLAARFIKAGADDFLSKPFEAEEFNCRVTHSAQMLEQVAELRELGELRNRFLGMAAHDLRSPINGIHGFSKMLMEGLCGELNEDQREVIEYIHTANRHMNSMVNDLLDISVIESGQLKLLRREQDFTRMVEFRLRVHTVGARQKNIRLEQEFEPLPEFLFDERRMGQVVDNLLSNALKFSPAGGTVRVSLHGEGADLVCSVCDQGEGIPPGEEDNLFASFGKTSVRPTAGESSTGLGLSIVRRIVEEHGGKVWVESEYGKGACFFFSLPLDRETAGEKN